MDQKKLVPKRRFEGFTKEWEERKLGNEVVFYSGLTYSPSDVVKSGGTLVLRSSNIKEGEIKDADNVYVSSEVVNSDNVQIGDIIVVVRNGSRSLIGKHAQIKKKMNNTVIGAFMTGVRYQQAAFMNALLSTSRFNSEVQKNMGATINQITTGAFKEMQFYFPNIDEQKHIGDFFINIDSHITLQQRKLEKAKALKSAYLTEMFPAEGERVPKRRFAGFTDDWEQHKLKDVVDLLKDGTHGTHKNGKEAFLLSAKNIKNGQLIIDELTDRKISGDDYNLIFQNYTLVDQDLLVTIVGTIGQTALYKESDIKLAFQRSVAIIRGNKNMNQNFLKSTVDSNYIQKQLKQAASMSAQAGVYLGDLEKLIIYIPKLLEQIKIGNFFKQLDETIANHQRKLEKLQALKQAYLHEMFV